LAVGDKKQTHGTHEKNVLGGGGDSPKSPEFEGKI